MFTLLVVAGGGLFGACKKGGAKVNSEPEREPSVVYEDVLPLEVEDGTLVRYTGETNAVIDIPASYSIDEYGNVVAGDTYQITKIANNAFSEVEFFDAYIDMTNVTEIGERAFEETKNITISEMPNLTMVRGYAFNKAKVNFENMNFEKVTYFGERSFAETSNYVIPAKSTLKEVHAADIEADGSYFKICAHDTIVNIENCAFAGSSVASGKILQFGKGIVRAQTNSGGDGVFENMGITGIEFTGGSYLLSGCCFQSNSNLTYVTFSGYFGALPDYLFSYCQNLVAVNLPNTGITSMGTDMFSDCTGLTSITRNPTAQTSGGVINFCFAADKTCALTTFTAPNSVTNIAGGAFRGFGSLTSITLPFIGSTRSIMVAMSGENRFGYIFGSSSFDGATSINFNGYSFYIPDTLRTINITDLSGSYSSIGTSAFYGMTNITTISVLGSYTSIGTYAFSGCSNLTSVTLGNSYTSIDNYAFSGCSSLTSLTVRSGVTVVGSYAFQNCTGLVAVNLPSTFQSFDNIGTTFSGCTRLTKITKNSAAQTSGGVINFCAPTTTVLLTRNTSVTLPSQITEIGAYAFYRFKHTNSSYYHPTVTFPSGLKTIGTYAFCGADLSSLSLPASVTTIGSYAFSEPKFTSVTIPTACTSIGESAFYGNDGYGMLTTVTFPSSPTATTLTIGGDAFSENLITTVSFPTSTSAYSNGLYLKKYCFWGNRISKVDLPFRIQEVGEGCFTENSNLTMLTRGSSAAESGAINLRWGNGSYCSCTIFHIPQSVTSVQPGVFNGFYLLQELFTPVSDAYGENPNDYNRFEKTRFGAFFWNQAYSGSWSSYFNSVTQTAPGGANPVFYIPKTFKKIHFLDSSYDGVLQGITWIEEVYLEGGGGSNRLGWDIGTIPGTSLKKIYIGLYRTASYIYKSYFSTNNLTSFQFASSTNWKFYRNGSLYSSSCGNSSTNATNIKTGTASTTYFRYN